MRGYRDAEYGDTGVGVGGWEWVGIIGSILNKRDFQFRIPGQEKQIQVSVDEGHFYRYQILNLPFPRCFLAIGRRGGGMIRDQMQEKSRGRRGAPPQGQLESGVLAEDGTLVCSGFQLPG